MKNKKNIYCFELHKSRHYHRNCSKKNKCNKTIVIRITTFDSKNDKSSQALQRRNKKNQ